MFLNLLFVKKRIANTQTNSTIPAGATFCFTLNSVVLLRYWTLIIVLQIAQLCYNSIAGSVPSVGRVSTLVLTLFERMVHVEQRQVVAVDVRESHLGLVRLLLGVVRPHETLRNYTL